MEHELVVFDSISYMDILKEQKQRGKCQLPKIVSHGEGNYNLHFLYQECSWPTKEKIKVVCVV